MENYTIPGFITGRTTTLNKNKIVFDHPLALLSESVRQVGLGLTQAVKEYGQKKELEQCSGQKLPKR